MRSESLSSWFVQQNSMIPHPAGSVTIGQKFPMHEPKRKLDKDIIKTIFLHNFKAYIFGI